MKILQSPKATYQDPAVSVHVDNDSIAQDFQREIHCLLGLPVDNLSRSAAIRKVAELVLEKRNRVLSTINVNWVVRSFFDPAFRDAIVNSDLITIDGKPLLWLGKLLGLPVKETVAGSTLIQNLCEERKGQPLTIFFFGGDDKAGKLVVEKLVHNDSGLYPVGWHNPGFGTVEQMSTEDIILKINKTKPDILLVALGAVKGVAWIEKNRHRLEAGIISHLGATIHFLAGTVRRAPLFLQICGLEWLWRIVQEPKLFTRYSDDGMAMLRTLLSRLPSWLLYHARRHYFGGKQDDANIRLDETEENITIRFGRNPRGGCDSPVRDLFQKIVWSDKHLILDFQRTRHVDSSFLGLIMLLRKYRLRHGKKTIFVNLNSVLVSVFHLYCLEYLLENDKD
jgi:N-acetylglucosaminyldiphosphoundecaprenol N-acetyl-beta-D-mannosaminyltransferase